MNNYVFRDENGQDWKRVTKKAAEKIYNKGVCVVICPVKLAPFGWWHPEGLMDKKEFVRRGYDSRDIEFSKFVNSFEYYNCINSETGRYSAFYIQVD